MTQACEHFSQAMESLAEVVNAFDRLDFDTEQVQAVIGDLFTSRRALEIELRSDQPAPHATGATEASDAI